MATEFDMKLVVWSTPVPPRGLASMSCPHCGDALNFHQPEDAFPARLIASCRCAECGVWFSVTLQRDRQQVYLFRIPSLHEMQDAMGRRLRRNA